MPEKQADRKKHFSFSISPVSVYKKKFFLQIFYNEKNYVILHPIIAQETKLSMSANRPSVRKRISET